MTEAEAIDIAKKRLGKRSIVLVGLMGCGKSSIGKRLAVKLGLPFVDADDEIERQSEEDEDQYARPERQIVGQREEDAERDEERQRLIPFNQRGGLIPRLDRPDGSAHRSGPPWEKAMRPPEEQQDRSRVNEKRTELGKPVFAERIGNADQ